MPRIQIVDLQAPMGSVPQGTDFSGIHGHPSKLPARVAQKLSEAIPFPSFAQYMSRCLFDPAFGYYSTGKVAFGSDKHFFTYPSEMRPVFGWMLAENALFLLKALLGRKAMPPGAPLTIMELGGGEGLLAKDVLDYISDKAMTARWRSIANKIQYVLIEKSPSLRERQEKCLKEYIRSNRARVIEADASHLKWKGCFYGIVFANELMDAFPCERIRIFDSGLHCSRVHVVPFLKQKISGVAPGSFPQYFQPFVDKGYIPMDSNSLWSYIVNSYGHKTTIYDLKKLNFKELEVPISLGWINDDGDPDSPPGDLMGYFEVIRPLVSDLEACGLLPADLLWSPILPRFVRSLSKLFHGKDRCGVALFIDYGGTSRHVLDPRSFGPHFRVYGDDESSKHRLSIYGMPGHRDMTWDVDFSELARLAKGQSLDAVFFGHQAALERQPIHLLEKPSQKTLFQTMLRQRTPDARLASLAAQTIVARFREAPGFRMILLAPQWLGGIKHPFGPCDPLFVDALDTVSPDMDMKAFEQMLSKHGLSEKVKDCVKPCGDPIADLSDLRLYRNRKTIMQWLREQGYLVSPGTLGRQYFLLNTYSKKKISNNSY
ncbi:MAG: SAM-dependent methyltransferase [Deltaproteobacteria bacterium]|nr:SAM-dependent methyltransferase [Deltaproteobacteria bacterium]